MADTTKTTKELKLVAGFADGDDRTITIDDPKDEITGSEIKALPTDAIIGDKAGADFKEWKSAQIVTNETTILDLTSA